MGVKRDWLQQAAEWAVADHTTLTNPRKAGAADYLTMLEESF